MTTGKSIALTTRTFADKVMSPLFNTLSRTLLGRCQLHPFLRRDDHRCLQTLPDVPWGWGTVAPGENYSVQCFGQSVSRGWCKPLDSLRCSEGQCCVRAERPAVSVTQLQWGIPAEATRLIKKEGLGGGRRDKAGRRQIRVWSATPTSLCSPAMSLTFLLGLCGWGGTAECGGPMA